MVIHTMKRFVSLAAWFVAGAVLGRLADTVVFELWQRLEFLLPVAHWFDLHGGETLVKCWFVLWLHTPSWLLSVLVGILGGRFIQRQPLPRLLLFGIGFVVIPLALFSYLYSSVPTPGSIAWDTVSIPLILLCGFLTHRRIQPPLKPLPATIAAPSG